MPIQLKGGIKGRQMSEVHMNIQVEIDSAHSFNGTFAGLKLDKTKCFDRRMPQVMWSAYVGPRAAKRTGLWVPGSLYLYDEVPFV